MQSDSDSEYNNNNKGNKGNNMDKNKEIKSNKSNKTIYFHKDALRIDWQEFRSQYKDNSIIIVGNLPYYITNSLIINLLFDYHLFKSLIFLVQKEVGQK